ncbi:nuclear transport factor 2 family protein [Persicitalea sp.]|uniref:nuclear transport factor 2 family protein n=1 Tax=Persicitalea sp. TaxID=3100273 RepID=UPI003593768D
MPIHKKIRQLPTVALLSATLLLFGNTIVQAQSAEVEVRAIVDQLFTGMKTGDSSLVAKSFTADATLQSVSMDVTGKVKTSKNGIESFVNAVGTPHKEIWDERIYDLKIQVDRPMATVWVPYKFYIGDKFSHCGVNAFTLIKFESGWKIASITDTRRKDGCL